MSKHATSPRQAIAMNCKDCTYDPKDAGGGTWRQQVENCTITACHLYPFRPLTTESMRLRREKQLQPPDYCPEVFIAGMHSQSVIPPVNAHILGRYGNG